VLGTVEGDLHSIGKDLVKMLLETGGFEVIDLGTDVPPLQFVTATAESKADIVAISALLTTTIPTMGAVIEALQEAGIRDRVKVLVGGAPVTQDYADRIGADGYGSSAGAGARLAKSWVSSDS
jgi:5-methyltetrahydrofolate--homocysteine methyltransferase